MTILLYTTESFGTVKDLQAFHTPPFYPFSNNALAAYILIPCKQSTACLRLGKCKFIGCSFESTTIFNRTLILYWKNHIKINVHFL